MCVGSLAGVTYLRYTVLTSSNKSKTAVHCCDPALSVLVMLVSRNVFHVVSALQSFACYRLMSGFVRISIHFFVIFFAFLNDCISVKTSPINTKLGDFVNLGVLLLTMWINSC